MPRIDPWSPAYLHLRGADERWLARIDRIGPCLLRPRKDRFGTLVRAIIGQQISTKAAQTIDGRLRAVGGTPHDPIRLLEIGEDGLRAVGLSGVKSRYVLHLSEAVASNRIPLGRIGRLPDEEIIELLTSIKGVGRWTAEMFLIFALNRPDVLAVGDLGVRVGLRNHHDLGDLPSPKDCERLAEPWRPFRSIAMWYLWRDLDTPVPKTAPDPILPPV